MPVYFASDMHLRPDRPDRADRLARWVNTLRPDDTLHLLGDVCDFWYATRERARDPMECPGLRALAEFRSRGGAITLLPGNHDLWLRPFYARVIGAEIVSEPRRLTVHGLRLHMVHGHRVGGRQPWKAAMESRAFFETFAHLPAALAWTLDHRLEGVNDRGRSDDEARLTKVFRTHARGLGPEVDLALFGHVHAPIDDPNVSPRLIILGGWHRQSSYLRLDDRGASLVIQPVATPVTA